MIDQVYQMISQGQQSQGQMRFNQGQQSQGQLRFNQGQGQMQNRFGQNRFNRGGQSQGQSQNFGQKRNGQNGSNKPQFNNREVFCTYCKKYRHQVANCLTLKAELKRRGYKIASGTNGFQNGFSSQRNVQGSNRGGFSNRGGKAGFQNRNGGRPGYQDRFNCMNEEDCDENYDDDMSNDELFMCCVSELQENTGLEFFYEESN